MPLYVEEGVKRGRMFAEEELGGREMIVYRYRGDRLTAPELKGMLCQAVRHCVTGKCVRGRNGSMLVFDDAGTVYNVLARQLRKVDKECKS